MSSTCTLIAMVTIMTGTHLRNRCTVSSASIVEELREKCSFISDRSWSCSAYITYQADSVMMMHALSYIKVRHLSLEVIKVSIKCRLAMIKYIIWLLLESGESKLKP